MKQQLLADSKKRRSPVPQTLRKLFRAALFLSGSLCVGSGWLYAGGLAQPVQSASAAGVANAFAATANDASALAYNPAGIAWQSGISLSAGLRLDFRDSAVNRPGVLDAPNSGQESTVGHLYTTWMPHDGRLGAGIGISPLYHVNNDWSTAFGASGGVTKLMIDHLTVDAIYAVSSDLALAAGGDWYFSRATMTKGAQSFKGNDLASFGGHLSMMWKPLPTWALGLMFRSGSKISISGQASDQLSFKLPDEVTAGIAHDFADVWRLETDVKWTRWSAMKDLNVTTGGAVTQSNPLSLKDTFAVMAGLTWTWRENSQLRAGYAYDQGANRNAGYNPVIADQDGHSISLGTGIEAYGFHTDLAYTYTHYAGKTATGTYAGTYRDRRQAISLSISKTIE